MTSRADNSSSAARCTPAVTEPGGAATLGHAAPAPSGSDRPSETDAERQARFLREARAL